MGTFLAVANRKGGVGKSTISLMLAHAFSTWGRKRTLVLDLDTQANASLMLIGGAQWKSRKDDQLTIADYIYDFFDHNTLDVMKYVAADAGDIEIGEGENPDLSLVPGSLMLEDIEHELLHKLAQSGEPLFRAEDGVRGRIARLLREYGSHYDLVILDCPPGLSLTTQAALTLAQKVIIPFRPEYVSAFAVDLMSRQVERKNLSEVVYMPEHERRYVTMANFWRDSGPNRTRLSEIESLHPVLQAKVPQKVDIAAAFDWMPNRVSIERKYREGLPAVQALYEEVSELLTQIEAGELEAAQ